MCDFLNCVFMNRGCRIFSVLLLLVFLARGLVAQPRLKFDGEGRFKIVQVTDMHINLKKGQSEVCFELLEEVIREERPDLVVFTGDQVTELNPQATWGRLVEQMRTCGVAWTMVFGNHDHEQGMSREEIYEMVKEAPNCLMSKGNVKGVGNYVLEIEGKQSRATAAVLYFLDSHSNCELKEVGGYQWVDFSQIAWLREQSARRECPSLLFMHIPLPEYNYAWNGKTFGVRLEEICCPRLNSGLFTALKESGQVMGVFAGHDHENDFIGVYYDIALGYGRVSAGKNAYGCLEPGVRVIELTEGKREFETYVRLKGGEVKNRCNYPVDFEDLKKLK